MHITAQVITDSRAPCGARLTTLLIKFPRFVLPEFLTHRVFERNAASSRAIPIGTLAKRVLNDPATPVHWGKNQPGMQAAESLTGWRLYAARGLWHSALLTGVAHAWLLAKVGVHKQLANRCQEAYSNVEMVVSATAWENFFALRCHRDAQPEFRKLASQMQDVYYSSRPKELDAGSYHLPFITEQELFKHAPHALAQISAGRCARVSLRTPGGKEDVVKDLALYEKLVNADPKHLSPLGHPAMALARMERCGPFVGFKQLRKFVEPREGF